MNKFKVIRTTDATAYTGSIAKILMLSGSTTEPGLIEDIVFGVYSSADLDAGTAPTPTQGFSASAVAHPSHSVTSQITADFQVPNGTYVDGPIIAVRFKTTTEALIYFNA
tara:strand:- start:601 stop:930 length:330 start_codon:yes stop_codon:yes gene_type:complete